MPAGRCRRILSILGGFENFCRMIGGTLSCAGIGGFLANVMDLYERMDLDTPQWEGFLDVWREVIGDSPITVANLIARINQSEELAAALPDTIATRDSRDTAGASGMPSPNATKCGCRTA